MRDDSKPKQNGIQKAESLQAIAYVAEVIVLARPGHVLYARPNRHRLRCLGCKITAQQICHHATLAILDMATAKFAIQDMLTQL